VERGDKGSNKLVRRWESSKFIFGAGDGKVGEKRCPL